MTVTDTSATQSAPRSDLAPLFYSAIEPLSAQLHKSLKIRPEAEYAFAAKTNTVPLTVPEFTMAARHYPILLLGDDLVPTAALGVQPEQNLFITPAGQWDAGFYVPAYIRRHPFILLGGNDDRLTLGIDVASAATGADARPLFKDDGKETEVVTQALDLCNQFHGAFLFTRDLSTALKKSDIVVDCTLEIEPTPGQRSTLGTFKRVDEEKFKEVPDSVILEWRKAGFLHAIHFLLQSMNNWDLLLIKAGLHSGAK